MSSKQFTIVVSVFLVTLIAGLGMVFSQAATQPGTTKKPPVGKPADPKRHFEGEELTEMTGEIENMKFDAPEIGKRNIFRPKNGQGFFILLENALLERLLHVTSNGGMLVKVSGVVTEYNGRNYLLLRRAAVKRTE